MDPPCEDTEKADICRLRREVSGETNLANTLTSESSLQNCEKINFCFISHSVWVFCYLHLEAEGLLSIMISLLKQAFFQRAFLCLDTCREVTELVKAALFLCLLLFSFLFFFFFLSFFLFLFFFFFFFFFFFVFCLVLLGLHQQHMEVPRLGSSQSCSFRPTPQPQQC